MSTRKRSREKDSSTPKNFSTPVTPAESRKATIGAHKNSNRQVKCMRPSSSSPPKMCQVERALETFEKTESLPSSARTDCSLSSTSSICSSTSALLSSSSSSSILCNLKPLISRTTTPKCASNSSSTSSIKSLNSSISVDAIAYISALTSTTVDNSRSSCTNDTGVSVKATERPNIAAPPAIITQCSQSVNSPRMVKINLPSSTSSPRLRKTQRSSSVIVTPRSTNSTAFLKTPTATAISISSSTINASTISPANVRERPVTPIPTATTIQPFIYTPKTTANTKVLSTFGLKTSVCEIITFSSSSLSNTVNSAPTSTASQVKLAMDLTNAPSFANTNNITNPPPPSPSIKLVKEPTAPLGAPTNYCQRRSWITIERMNELRRRAQDAVKQNKTFTIRGCFNSVRNALTTRGWVEKLDLHRKHTPNGICQVTYDDLAQGLPKRKPGETRRQYILKCERNIMSRFLEHMPIDFLWTNRKEKCDYIDQAKNPGMTINKFHRAPFTSKEGLCNQLRDFHWFYEEGTAEMYFPRCFNVWSPEELGEFIENFKMTACVAFMRAMVHNYRRGGFDAVFSPFGKIPFSAIEFATKRCTEYIDCCQHNDIDVDDPPRIWEHDWDAFLNQHFQLTSECGRILSDQHRTVESVVHNCAQLLESLQNHWPQYTLDGYRNLWIVKPANKCRGRGIQLLDNLKKILTIVNPPIASKSRYVVQKYIERPLIIHSTKFDIRQWFLVTNVQPLVVWLYKDSYLRFSSQQYSLSNHHESVHLTNHAIQKKYTNGKRDKRLPNENMWDCYSFQAYLRQIGKQDLWFERIYPGMKRAIVGTMLSSQENMDRRPNTFELFGADFMICEDFYPWLIEINSSPDLGATTSVTARMCPQCLEDVIKVVIDRRADPKADPGNFELVYRQIVPPTPAYMGLNLFVKGKQIMSKVQHNHNYYYHHRSKERSLHTSNFFRQRTALIPTISNVLKAMPTFNATDYMERCMVAEIATLNSSRSNVSSTGCIAGHASTVSQQYAHALQLAFGSGTGLGSCNVAAATAGSNTTITCQSRKRVVIPTATTMPCPNLLRSTQAATLSVRRRSFTNLPRASQSSKVPAQATTTNQDQSPSSASKRHRSCGPRLTIGNGSSGAPRPNAATHEIEKKFKMIIRKCTIQKSVEHKRNTLSTGSVTNPIEGGRPTAAAFEQEAELECVGNSKRSLAGKSEDNIVELMNNRGGGRGWKTNARLILSTKSSTSGAVTTTTATIGTTTSTAIAATTSTTATTTIAPTTTTISAITVKLATQCKTLPNNPPAATPSTTSAVHNNSIPGKSSTAILANNSRRQRRARRQSAQLQLSMNGSEEKKC